MGEKKNNMRPSAMAIYYAIFYLNVSRNEELIEFSKLREMVPISLTTFVYSIKELENKDIIRTHTSRTNLRKKYISLK